MIKVTNYTGRNTTHNVRKYLGNGEFSSFETKDHPFATPWGRAIDVTLYARGLRNVRSTKGEGFMLSNKLAEKNLSKGARKLGIQYGGYLCFELANGVSSVIHYELPEVAKIIYGRELTTEDLKGELDEITYVTYMMDNNSNFIVESEKVSPSTVTTTTNTSSI